MSKNKVLISSQTKINDPILKDFIKVTEQAILMSVNNQLLRKYSSSSKNLKYSGNAFMVGAKKKTKKDTTAEIILKALSKEKAYDEKVFTKQLFRKSSRAYGLNRNFKSLVNVKGNIVSYDEKTLKELYKNVPLKKINKKYLDTIINGLATAEEEHAPSTAVINKGMEFQLAEVRCINPTDWEPGNDEIAMSAIFLDGAGEDSRYNEFRVRNDFDSGDRKTYPHMIMNRFDLSKGSYPQTCTAVLALSEKDNGGFSDFMSELYEAIKEEVQVILTVLGAAAGAYIGTAIGGTIGTAIAGPLGTIIGVIAGAVLGALIGLLAGALKDDIFPPQTETVTLPTANVSFDNGSLTSRYYYSNFIDHGAEYRVKYRWKINR